MKKLLSILLILFFFNTASFAQYAKWNDTELILNNGVIERTISLPKVGGKFITKTYKPLDGEFNYFTTNNIDFQFEFGSEVYSGNSNWKLIGIEDSKRFP
jgi:alpha-galactosidase